MIHFITPEQIVSLKPNEVFVFGSNLQGIHGKGAAKQAFNEFGAIWGKGKGLYGQSYALPTKRTPYIRMVSKEINAFVQDFIQFTVDDKDLIFLVTEIGCGLAGYTVQDIAPMFEECLKMNNVSLPKRFIEILTNR